MSKNHHKNGADLADLVGEMDGILRELARPVASLRELFARDAGGAADVADVGGVADTADENGENGENSANGENRWVCADGMCGAKSKTRAARFSQQFGEVFCDYSKNRFDEGTFAALARLCAARGVGEKIAAMFAGERINASENRAALHVALRASEPVRAAIAAKCRARGDAQIVSQIERIGGVLRQMCDFAEAVRSGAWLGATGRRVRNVINIGIGGSDLGVKLACEALAEFCAPHLRAFFVSNADLAQLRGVLAQCEPAETLFVVASKTFTTQETMLNANAAREWVLAGLGGAAGVDFGADFAKSGAVGAEKNAPNSNLTLNSGEFDGEKLSENHNENEPAGCANIAKTHAECAQTTRTIPIDCAAAIISRHFVAASANVPACRAFGVGRVFEFWDFVGGRFSVWSAVGLTLCVMLGARGFGEFLRGAADVDAAFARASGVDLGGENGGENGANSNLHGAENRAGQQSNSNLAGGAHGGANSNLHGGAGGGGNCGENRAKNAGAENVASGFDFARNLPAILAALDVLNALRGVRARAVLAYPYALRSFAAFVQQLEMESNGKVARGDFGGGLAGGFGGDFAGFWGGFGGQFLDEFAPNSAPNLAKTAPQNPAQNPLQKPCAAVVFGGCGSNAQHAFMQAVHQGAQAVACDFVAVRGERVANANALAQARALAFGRTFDEALAEVRRELTAKNGAKNGGANVAKNGGGNAAENPARNPAQNLGENPPNSNLAGGAVGADKTGGAVGANGADNEISADGATAWARFLAHSRTFDGDRASSFFALRELSPRSLGALIAIFEHRTFVEGVLLGVNSFDQWGVELGKKICGDILQNRGGFDTSTTQLAEILGV